MTSAAFYEQSGLMNRIDPQERSRLLGDVVTILLASDTHRHYLINDIGALFLPALHLQQFRIYRVAGRPVGIVTWAWLSQAVDVLYAGGDYRLRPEDWNAGPCGWIVDFAAPFGHAAAMTRDLRAMVFPGQTGKALRMKPGNPSHRVIGLRGVGRQRG